MTGWPVPPVPSAHAQAAALRAAFPGYTINVITRRGDKPRFEAVSRDGGSPYCLISADAREIWRELRGHGSPGRATSRSAWRGRSQSARRAAFPQRWSMSRTWTMRLLSPIRYTMR